MFIIYCALRVKQKEGLIMYLYIFEDGEIKYSKREPRQDDVQDVNNGFLSIVYIKNPWRPLELYNGIWNAVPGIDEETQVPGA